MTNHGEGYIVYGQIFLTLFWRYTQGSYPPLMQDKQIFLSLLLSLWCPTYMYTCGVGYQDTRSKQLVNPSGSLCLCLIKNCNDDGRRALPPISCCLSWTKQLCLESGSGHSHMGSSISWQELSSLLQCWLGLKEKFSAFTQMFGS